MEEIIFPNQIRIYRKMHGRTMQSLADELNMSLSAISKIEKGYRRLDQQQLMHVADFLECNLQDLFVNEINSQPEVVQAWKREQERRSHLNVSTGLKTMGAGLRHIRNEKNLTLIEVAKNARMTLSVYHRIEMGQREVSEHEFDGIAKALSIAPDDLRKQIKQLDEEGLLCEIIQKNNVKYRSLATPKGGNGIDNTKVALCGKAGNNGSIIIDTDHAEEKISRPQCLYNKAEAYALHMCTNRFGNFLPESAILFVDPSIEPKVGDTAVYYQDENSAFLVRLANEKGSLVGLITTPDEKIKISPDAKIHKVVLINL